MEDSTAAAAPQRVWPVSHLLDSQLLCDEERNKGKVRVALTNSSTSVPAVLTTVFVRRDVGRTGKDI